MLRRVMRCTTLASPKDDYMFTTIKVVSRHEDTQLYGAILPNELTNEDIRNFESYKEYYAIALGAEPPKTKARVKKKKVESDMSKTPPTKGKRLKTSAKAAKTAKKKQPATTSKAKGVDEGTGSIPGVPDVPTYESDDEQISWKSSKEDDDDEVNVSEDDDDENDDDIDKDDEDDDADNQDDENANDANQDDDDEQTNDEESDDESNEDSDEEVQGTIIEEKEMDEEATYEEDEANELYRDVNVNLEGRDTEMTDAPLPNVQGTQVTEDTHVIITAPVNPEGQQQSSSMSFGFVSNMLNPSPDTGIDIIFTLNNETTSLVDVLATTIAEPHILSATTLPLPPTPLITHLQQTPFKQTKQFAKAVSSIPSIVDAYLANKMHEAVKIDVQLQSERLRDEAQAENADFLNKLDDNIKKIIKEQVRAQVSKILPKIEKTVNEKLEAEVMTRSSTESKTSLAIAANLSELELKKILIDKMESNKSIYRSDEKESLQSTDDEDKDKEPSAGSNRGSKRRRAGKEPESTSAPKEKTSKTSGKSHEGSLAQKEDPRELFNELIDTPLDFSAFVMNRLKVDTLTPELLTGPTFKLMKGSCKSLVELEYLFEEVYKATTEQLDWNNLEGQQYPHDLRNPLTLIPNSQGRRVIPFDHFINNDLEYLSGGNLLGMSTPNAESLLRFQQASHSRHEDMLLLLVQGKFTNLTIEERLAFNVSLRMFTRSVVIQRRVENLQLGVKSYQKKLNLTKTDIDGTLNDVRTALNERLKGIRMEYLPQAIWRQSDKDKAGAMIQAIDK
ncbi:hypothetical protein Tco_0949285 [Tanacetum coccineum]